MATTLSKKDERQQSLINARRACELLTAFASNEDQSLFLKQSAQKYIAALIAEFMRLDEKELRQAEAGREFGHLGAKHGKKGGWKKGRPRKETK